MTPSERERAEFEKWAENFLKTFPEYEEMLRRRNRRNFISVLASTAQAARREERKRCAEIADSIAMSNYGNASLASAKIASVIRALDKETA